MPFYWLRNGDEAAVAVGGVDPTVHGTMAGGIIVFTWTDRTPSKQELAKNSITRTKSWALS